MSFRKRDKIPYGTFVAYESLPLLFPGATVVTEKNEPGGWDSLSDFGDHQALLIIAPSFNADEFEMKKLIHFVENGNDVFISTMHLSYYAEKFMKCDVYYPGGVSDILYMQDTGDSMTLSLTNPSLHKPQTYSYPGKSYDFWFYNIDSLTSTVLGYNKEGKPDFIHLKAGKGNLFVHLAPMAFSNYFLLHKNNIAYYENALSYISPLTTKLVWDEYFLQKRDKKPDEKKPGWFSVFLRYPALRWGLITALAALLLYVLMEMRRKQRPIPLISKPRNDSLDFVKTIGRLYYDKGDHKNLCRKMSAYFLEHVRNRYKLSTSRLDEEFVKSLHYKSGIDEKEISEIVSFIASLDQLNGVSDRQLLIFHRQLESFYKKA